MAADRLRNSQAYLACPVARRAAAPPPLECVAVLRPAVTVCGYDLGAHSRISSPLVLQLGAGFGVQRRRRGSEWTRAKFTLHWLPTNVPLRHPRARRLVGAQTKGSGLYVSMGGLADAPPRDQRRPLKTTPACLPAVLTAATEAYARSRAAASR